jgi:hypothetical protein
MSGVEQGALGGTERKTLPRNEHRFRYFYPNGKPVLHSNSSGFLGVKTTYERVVEQEAA